MRKLKFTRLLGYEPSLFGTSPGRVSHGPATFKFAVITASSAPKSNLFVEPNSPTSHSTPKRLARLVALVPVHQFLKDFGMDATA